MNSTTLSLSSIKPLTHFTKPKPSNHNNVTSLRVTASLKTTTNPILQTLKNAAISTVLLATAISFSSSAAAAAAARADQEPMPVSAVTVAEEIDDFKALKMRIQNDLDYQETLEIVDRVVESDPEGIEWKFLKARLLGQMGQLQNSRKVYEEILGIEPLLIEALFENAVVMGKCGESSEVIGEMLRDVAKRAELEGGGKDVKLVTGLVKFVERDFDGAMESFREVSEEDLGDRRGYFCRAMVCGVIGGREGEAEELFSKYWELLDRNVEVEGLVKFPLSVVKAEN